MSRKISILAFVLTLPLLAQGANDWRLDPSQGSWSQHEERDACYLVHDMAPFGRMILSQGAGGRVAGVVVAARPPSDAQLGEMIAVTPAWKGEGHEVLRLVEASPGLNALRFDDRTARMVLSQLETGDFVVLRFEHWNGPGAEAHISPVGLRAALGQQSECLLSMPDVGAETAEGAGRAQANDSGSVTATGPREPVVFHFDTDSANLDEADLERLQSLARDLRTRIAWHRIEISGHTDHTGSRARNEALALARALEVRDRLVQFGISAERIDVRARPATSSASAETDPSERASARRAEIRPLL